MKQLKRTTTTKTMLAALFFTIASSLVFAADDGSLSALRQNIDKIKEEMRAEQNQWGQERDKEEEKRQSREQKIAALEQEKAAIDESIAELERQIQSALNGISAYKRQEADAESLLTSISSMVVGQAQSLKRTIDDGLPARKAKRSESVELLIMDAKRGEISPEEAFNRLWALYQSEIRMCSDSEVITDVFQFAPGEDSQVKVLRLGKVLLAMSSFDESNVGILQRGADGTFRWAIDDELDFSERQAVRDAVRIAEGKGVPGLIEAPFWIDPPQPVTDSETTGRESDESTDAR